MRMNKRIATAIVVLSLASASQAEEARSTSAVTKETFWQQTSALVPIQVVLPPDYYAKKHRTMVMVLYGYANSAEKFQGPAERLAAAGFVAVLPESPYAFVSEWGLGYDWTLYNRGDAALHERARRLMVTETLPAIASEVKRRYGIDDVYVLGFSQGARVAVQTCVYASELFKGAITFGLSEYKPAWFDQSALESARRIPFLLFHGEQDEWAEVAISKRARDHLVAEGFEVSLRLFPGGHAVPGDQLDYVAQWIRDNE